ncbi:MAG: glycosyltransferase family 4 protein [Anaerolineae bacterium]|nr:glycosyltransferase family 4 protein [Anaerolineae bacterium]
MLSGDTSVVRGQDGPFYQMLRRFSHYWTRIDILCPPVPDAHPRCIHDNVYLHPSPYRRSLWQPYFIARHGRKLMRERDYALVVSHDYGLFLNGIGARLLRKPYVSEIHHVEGYPIAVSFREWAYSRLAKTYIRWAARSAAIRVVNEHEMPVLLRQLGVPEKKILVLPSQYLNLDVLRPLPDEPKPYDVLFVGRLASNKGLMTLLQAIDLVKDTHPHVQLGIRGEGTLYEEVRDRIIDLKLQVNVTFIPRVDTPEDLTHLYNQTLMLVCASTSEGGPRVTVEAMACGIPVISTPVGIMPDIIKEGENGFLFHWNAYDLAAKIIVLLDHRNLRAKIGEAGRQTVQQFEADTMIERYARGYHDLIAALNLV